MSVFRVTAEWEGSAAIEIDCADENRAEEIARATWVGFIVEGGEIEYVISSVEEVDA